MLREFTKALCEVWRLSVPDAGSYRPDLHYMRGPGPKWRAKYGHLRHEAEPTHGPGAAAMQDLAERRV